MPDLAASHPHRSPEQRIDDQEDIQTFEDLDGLSSDMLREIALQCMEEPADPDACVSCRAYVIYTEDMKAMEEQAAAVLENPVAPPPLTEKQEAQYDALMSTSVDYDEEDEPPQDLPRLRELMEEPSIFEEPVEDLRLQFIQQVHDLDMSVRRLMEGPPIPPANVSLEDLAALKLGAEEWVKSTQQLVNDGYGLPPAKMKIRDAVERVIERLNQ